MGFLSGLYGKIAIGVVLFLLVFGVYYRFHVMPMNELAAKTEKLELIKTVTKETKAKTDTYEAVQKVKLENVKEKNEKIDEQLKELDKTSGVDTSIGKHTISL